MKLLKCSLCKGEVDIIGGEFAVCKKIKCRKCGFSNQDPPVKEPEVFIIRKRQ